jgi:hypothetical protein
LEAEEAGHHPLRATDWAGACGVGAHGQGL